MHQLSQKRKKKRKKLHRTYLVEPIPNSIGESKPNKINPKSQQIIKKSNPKSQSKISLSLSHTHTHNKLKVDPQDWINSALVYLQNIDEMYKVFNYFDGNVNDRILVPNLSTILNSLRSCQKLKRVLLYD